MHMKVKIGLVFLAFLLVLGACSQKERRIQLIQERYPQWDQATVDKVASGTVEIGMTNDMVIAALGKPDIVENTGTGEKWSFAVWKQHGEHVFKVYVYFVFFKEGKVFSTTGDPKDLEYTQWYR